MIAAVVFGILSIFFSAALLVFLIRLGYYRRKGKKYRDFPLDEERLALLQKEYKKARRYRRNFLLYLILRDLAARGETENAARLRPFLRPDPFYDFSDVL